MKNIKLSFSTFDNNLRTVQKYQNGEFVKVQFADLKIDDLFILFDKNYDLVSNNGFCLFMATSLPYTTAGIRRINCKNIELKSDELLHKILLMQLEKYNVKLVYTEKCIGVYDADNSTVIPVQYKYKPTFFETLQGYNKKDFIKIFTINNMHILTLFNENNEPDFFNMDYKFKKIKSEFSIYDCLGTEMNDLRIYLLDGSPLICKSGHFFGTIKDFISLITELYDHKIENKQFYDEYMTIFSKFNI